MKTKKILTLIFVILVATILVVKIFWEIFFFQNISTFMDENKLDTSVVAISQEVSGTPVWSLDSRYLYSNISGIWYEFDLHHFYGDLGQLRGQEVGIPVAVRHEEVDINEVDNLKGFQKSDSRKITTTSSTTIELKEIGLSMGMIATKRGGQPKLVWETDMDTCHSLSLSPDEKFVAYICDTSGLAVFRTDFRWNYEDYILPPNVKKEVTRNPTAGVSKLETTTYENGHTYTKIILDGNQSPDDQWAEISKHLK